MILLLLIVFLFFFNIYIVSSGCGGVYHVYVSESLLNKLLTKNIESVGAQNNRIWTENVTTTYHKVKKKTNIRKRYDQALHLTQDTTWESDKTQ